MSIFNSKQKVLKYDREKVIKISDELFPDELCERCGRCCIIHVFNSGDSEKPQVIYCTHLDKETKLCKIYKNRFKKEDECLTVMEAIMIGALPKDCPYVKNLKNYKEPKFYNIVRNLDEW